MSRRTRTQIHIEIGQPEAHRYRSVGDALAANTGLIARLIEEGRKELQRAQPVERDPVSRRARAS